MLFLYGVFWFIRKPFGWPYGSINPQSVIRPPILHIRLSVSSSSVFRTAIVILFSAFSRCSPLHLRQKRKAICLTTVRNTGEV